MNNNTSRTKRHTLGDLILAVSGSKRCSRQALAAATELLENGHGRIICPRSPKPKPAKV